MHELLQQFMNFSNPEQVSKLDLESFRSFQAHLYWKDRQGKYLGCNDLLIADTGFNKQSDILGHTDFDICTEPSAASLRYNDLVVVENEKSITLFEKAIVRNNGPTFNVISHKVPLRSRSQKVIGIMGISLILDTLSHRSFKPNTKYHINNTAITFSTREAECLNETLNGYSAKEIATILGISPRTIEAHLDKIRQKLNCKSKLDLINKLHNRSCSEFPDN